MSRLYVHAAILAAAATTACRSVQNESVAKDSPSSSSALARFDTQIDTRTVNFGQPQAAGTYHLIVTAHAPQLPAAATGTNTGVDVKANDPDISSDDEYACVSEITFPSATMRYVLTDIEGQEVWSESRQIPTVHARSGESQATEIDSCPSQITPGEAPLGQIDGHGASFNVQVTGGTLVLRPFDNGVWLDGNVTVNAALQAQLTALTVQPGPRKLHWGFHRSGSTSGTFAGGGFVDMQRQ